jgi:hypothetical protein
LCEPGATVRQGIPDLFSATIPEAPGILGDMNGDGNMNAADVRPFLVGINHPREFAYSFGLDAVNFGDMNGDGVFDVGDIDGFASELMADPSTITAQLDAPLADYNGDGFVTPADYTVWRNTRGQQGSRLAADATGNGVVDLSDYYVWKAEYAQALTAHVAQGAIPEPTTAVLVLVAAVTAAAAPLRCRAAVRLRS